MRQPASASSWSGRMRLRNLTSRARRRVALFAVFLSLFLLTSHFSVLSSQFSVRRVSAQPQISGAVPTPPSVLISPRRSAAFGAVIVAALLFLQYAHRRKPFILLWALGWLLIAPAMLLIARGYES